ncbi:hypothetical protein Ga0102493_111384 [Erythrobacter litoralis]|nr:hypothetical protein Ga0102493_111384 [Erythrobacter litoralis]
MSGSAYRALYARGARAEEGTVVQHSYTDTRYDE